MSSRIETLLSIPKIEQKSELWYEMRYNMITASDFAQALGKGKFGTQKQLIEKKCTPRGNESSVSKTNPFFKWGNMFEPVACKIYSKLHNNVVVHEFGLLQHPLYKFFGASPDGITDDGIMLEIKCPFKRKITGDIPTQYYYQIQGQLDVCDLDECDYFECTFDIVSKDVFIVYNGIKGILSEPNECEYEYKALYMNQKEFNEFNETSFMDSENKYWVLKEYNIIRVKRDKVFINDNLKLLNNIWDKILYYRSNQNEFNIDILNQIDIETEKHSYNKLGTNNKKKSTIYELINTDKYMFID